MSQTERERQSAERLGRQVALMIRDVVEAGEKEGVNTGYARQTLTFPGGSVELLVCSKDVATVMEAAVGKKYEVYDVTPGSQIN